MLFSLRAKTTAQRLLLYVLIEHQSRPDRHMLLRLLRYMIRAWEEHLKRDKHLRDLPMIFPMVLYSGRRRWRAPRAFRDLLSGASALPADARKHLPDLEPVFLDLHASGAADERVDRLLSDYGKLILWAMAKAGDDRGLIEGLRKFRGVLSELLRQRDAHGALEVLWRYLLATHRRIDAARLERFVVEEVEPDAGGLTMTVYDRLVEKGRKLGRSEGRQEGRKAGLDEGRKVGLDEGRKVGLDEGRAELLLEQLLAKFGAVPAATRARIRRATTDELTRWGRRVLTAEALGDVLQPAAPEARPARERQSPKRAPSRTLRRSPRTPSIA